jgi:hypothetical protein
VRVHLGGDHAAYDLLVDLVSFLEAEGHEVTNHGPHAYDEVDDYPVYVLRAAEAVAADPGSRGVVLGGSGNGEQMAANKVSGIRAALHRRAHDECRPGALDAAGVPHHAVQRRRAAPATHRDGLRLRARTLASATALRAASTPALGDHRAALADDVVAGLL